MQYFVVEIVADGVMETINTRRYIYELKSSLPEVFLEILFIGVQLY